MNQFFLAYEVFDHWGVTRHKGFRLFSAEATTEKEVGDLLNNKLDEICKQYPGDNYNSSIIATAFNKI